ncbi:MAG: hypothetical protein LBR65_09805 [Culturomica sp.]|jgi:hypothetical protein|nr:hypothetical protein [Culturomica sp.]
MKKQDFLFAGCFLAILAPFFLSSSVYDWYLSFNRAHGLMMSFLKFAVLSTAGEMIGLRITAGVYNRKGFGLLPRALVWGILGMGISMAMTLFAGGTPILLEQLGVDGAVAAIGGPLSWGKAGVAFAISVAMNTVFAPVFMTLHKMTDLHIVDNGGTVRGFFTPFKAAGKLKKLNWDVQWNFVFKKTIPLFWFPAHTVTFLLPGNFRVLFAALLGVVLGVLLSVAARKK